MTAYGISEEKLCLELGISKDRLDKLKNRKTKPTPKEFDSLVHIFNTQPSIIKGSVSTEGLRDGQAIRWFMKERKMTFKDLGGVIYDKTGLIFSHSDLYQAALGASGDKSEGIRQTILNQLGIETNDYFIKYNNGSIGGQGNRVHVQKPKEVTENKLIKPKPTTARYEVVNKSNRLSRTVEMPSNLAHFIEKIFQEVGAEIEIKEEQSKVITWGN